VIVARERERVWRSVMWVVLQKTIFPTGIGQESICATPEMWGEETKETTQKLQTLLLHLHFNALLLCLIKAFCFRERKRL
jgi:hypothetical protein